MISARVTYKGLTYTMVEVFSSHSQPNAQILHVALQAARETPSSIFGHRITQDPDDATIYIVQLFTD